MGLVLLVLVLALILGGLGFALHALWIIAAIVFVGWLLGFGMRMGEGRRWYRWLSRRPGRHLVRRCRERENAHFGREVA